MSKGKLSDWREVISRDPQRLVLGPTLFNIHDLAFHKIFWNKNRVMKVLKFTDDINVEGIISTQGDHKRRTQITMRTGEIEKG